MKLAEALALRADLNTRLRAVGERAVHFSRVQEGGEPPEDPVELLAEHHRILDQLERLVTHINETNLTTEVGPGQSMTAALAGRDSLRARHGLLTRMATEASERTDRFTRTELRNVPTIDVRVTRQRADEVAVALRELDTAIQRVNWTAELRGE